MVFGLLSYWVPPLILTKRHTRSPGISGNIFLMKDTVLSKTVFQIAALAMHEVDALVASRLRVERDPRGRLSCKIIN